MAIRASARRARPVSTGSVLMAIRIVPGVAVPRPGNQPAPRLVPPHRRLPSRAASGHGGPMDSKDFPYLVAPEPADCRLTTRVRGLDHDGRAVELPVVNEQPLTIYLNRQEIVTVMNIGDRPGELEGAAARRCRERVCRYV